MLINMKTFLLYLCILFTSFTAISCSDNKNQSATDYSNSLIILNKASNVKYAKSNETDQISYKLIEQYPAKRTISELNNRLKNMGWQPLKRNWLNPQIPTSHERGWTNYIDGTKNPNLEVHSWKSDWKNKIEDILTFSLRYSYPVKNKSNMKELKVTGIYIPEEVAKISLERINEYKKSFEKNRKNL